jgi:hypothetical protein
LTAATAAGDRTWTGSARATSAQSGGTQLLGRGCGCGIHPMRGAHEPENGSGYPSHLIHNWRSGEFCVDPAPQGRSGGLYRVELRTQWTRSSRHLRSRCRPGSTSSLGRTLPSRRKAMPADSTDRAADGDDPFDDDAGTGQVQGASAGRGRDRRDDLTQPLFETATISAD